MPTEPLQALITKWRDIADRIEAKLEAQKFKLGAGPLMAERVYTLRVNADELEAALQGEPSAPRPIRAHVEGCPKSLRVPVDRCECGGRDFLPALEPIDHVGFSAGSAPAGYRFVEASSATPAQEDDDICMLAKIRTLVLKESGMDDVGTTYDLVATLVYATQRLKRQRDELANQCAPPSAPGGVTDKQTAGLYRKFRVERTDGTSDPGQKHHGCEYFVLDVTHDPYAKPALRAYAQSCRANYPALADDLERITGAFPPGGAALREMAYERFVQSVRRPASGLETIANVTNALAKLHHELEALAADRSTDG